MIVELLALLFGLLAGGVLHELAHYVVLKAAGVECWLQALPPRVKFRTSEPVSMVVRFAAVAPALAGVLVLAGSVGLEVTGTALGAAGWLLAAGVFTRLVQLSPQDRQVARGQLSSTRSRS